MLAGYSISYITPIARVGGEPMRIYMLKKEFGMSTEKAAAGIILDRFVEFSGAILFGIIGIFFLAILPRIPASIKISLSLLVGFVFSVLMFFYFRTISNTSSFSLIFNFLQLHRFSRLKKFGQTLKKIENKLNKFFIENKKAFIKSVIAYIIYIFLIILESKFLLLGFGINASVYELILILNIHGLATFIPIPAALGALEAGESMIFKVLREGSSLGIAYSLIIRIRDIIFVSIGFIVISYFSGSQIEEYLAKKEKKKKR